MKNRNEIDELIDSDDDGIPDLWEINGYTVENGVIVAWNEKKHRNKFIKYGSDPYNSHTTGDPYSDSEKVLNKVDKSILREARHPLVAAYPNVGIVMDKIILSNNKNVSVEKGGSTSKESSKTITISTSTGKTSATSVGASFSISPTGPSGGASVSHEVSTTITHEESNSSTESNQVGSSWTKTLGLNTSEVAYLNGNLKYINIGTATIYNAQPTLNFILGVGKKASTIATIKAKSNTISNAILPNTVYINIKLISIQTTISNAILPNTVYPDDNLNPIAWNTIDDFSSQYIKLNYEQVEALQHGTPLMLQPVQKSGFYKLYNADNLRVITDNNRWENIMTDINSTTATIRIITLSGFVEERKIAVRKEKDYDKQKLPELTLGEALELAFDNVTMYGKKNYYTPHFVHKYAMFPLEINVSMAVSYNDYTRRAVDRMNRSEYGNNFFNIKLFQGMFWVLQEKFFSIAVEEKIVTETFEKIKSILQQDKISNGVIYVRVQNKEEAEKELVDINKKIREFLRFEDLPLAIFNRIVILSEQIYKEDQDNVWQLSGIKITLNYKSDNWEHSDKFII